MPDRSVVVLSLSRLCRAVRRPPAQDPRPVEVHPQPSSPCGSHAVRSSLFRWPYCLERFCFGDVVPVCHRQFLKRLTSRETQRMWLMVHPPALALFGGLQGKSPPAGMPHCLRLPTGNMCNCHAD